MKTGEDSAKESREESVNGRSETQKTAKRTATKTGVKDQEEAESNHGPDDEDEGVDVGLGVVGLGVEDLGGHVGGRADEGHLVAQIKGRHTGDAKVDHEDIVVLIDLGGMSKDRVIMK